jgi:hypothetical protein
MEQHEEDSTGVKMQHRIHQVIEFIQNNRLQARPSNCQ